MSRRDLLYFLNADSSAESKRVFAADWSYLRLAILQSQLPTQRVWPFNVALALRSTLVRLDAQMASKRLPADANASLDSCLQYLDEASSSLSRVIGSDTPGELQTQWEKLLLQDAYAFPNDSLIYRDWKALSGVISTIDKAISNLELHTRSLTLKNDVLLAQIQEMDAFNYVQDRFIEKFQLGRATDNQST